MNVSTFYLKIYALIQRKIHSSKVVEKKNLTITKNECIKGLSETFTGKNCTELFFFDHSSYDLCSDYL